MLSELKYTRFALEIYRNTKLVTMDVSKVEEVGETSLDFLRIYDNEMLPSTAGYPSTPSSWVGGKKLTRVTAECTIAPGCGAASNCSWSWSHRMKACPDGTAVDEDDFDDDTG